MTRDAGLAVSSYGSYYRAGEPPAGDNPDFAAVLESARALEAPTIRVWSGRQASAAADDAYRGKVEADLQRVAALAASAGITVACEHHGGTLTDTPESARRLYAQVAQHHVSAYWQPCLELSCAENLAALHSLLPCLANLHVFHWALTRQGRQRCALAAGQAEWEQYLHAVRALGQSHWALLEFVKDDRPEQFLEDAATLRSWLAAVAPPAGASPRP